ncbi:hypothetical protein [Opitutus terrae]|uniref:Uncharacterized protein n=1 Tax=Opitutus terrae (strain DSM 11246 / JCM 15787 / PB90-1) TaxID=452637 RepID=B1ZRI8_OPITP|nr:hypothetical protein [Opitutus terrae]ACB77638.1 hypothetical protein Oter_4367 [Opitutus terrae PB90-1]
MNNGPQEPSTISPTRASRTPTSADELETLKRELMKAEVRLAKARATVTGAEIDVKVLNARLKAFTR